MRTIIAGSRSITCSFVVDKSVKLSGFEVSEVVCGMARGVDMLGRTWAIQNKIYYSCWPAQWQTHGKSAGFIRNQEMADYADALIAIWDGESRGTKDMINRATLKGLEVYIYKAFPQKEELLPLWGSDLD